MKSDYIQGTIVTYYLVVFDLRLLLYNRTALKMSGLKNVRPSLGSETLNIKAIKYIRTVKKVALFPFPAVPTTFLF